MRKLWDKKKGVWVLMPEAWLNHPSVGARYAATKPKKRRQQKAADPVAGDRLAGKEKDTDE